MSKSSKYFFLILAVPVFLSLQFCKKQTEAFAFTTSVNDYYPLEVGKYIVYQMDSTVFVNFDTHEEVHSYQVKDIVDAEIADNLGRPSYRIRRMIRDSAGMDPWVDNATFMITPLKRSIEVVENNLRFIKLTSPVKENYYWRGNSYINAVNELDYLAFWDYTYTSVGQPFSLDNISVENTVTVLQNDYSTGDPSLAPTQAASKNYSIEIYGKDIGLIYKDFIYWLYNKNEVYANCRVVIEGIPDTPCAFNINCDSLAQALNGYKKCDTISSNYSYIGYGIKLKMLEHN
ncbi:hypothetical protein [Agriterribacter sp.]|uniref:hypothetical protein n=1 Tax=Agriterribacter sp. TaxID=2821509 RepID=UPI002B7F2920|nr:hypothetical protein [Agriterribacter sp.]HRP55781.1 hypothetical protein [Agriterribacter sp.]